MTSVLNDRSHHGADARQHLVPMRVQEEVPATTHGLELSAGDLFGQPSCPFDVDQRICIAVPQLNRQAQCRRIDAPWRSESQRLVVREILRATADGRVGGGNFSADIVSFNPSLGASAQILPAGVAVADNGSVLAAWAQIAMDGQSKSVMARYYNGTSWGPITTLHTASGDVSTQGIYSDWQNEPAAALNAQGDGIVAFPVFGGTLVARLHGNNGSFDNAVEVAIESSSYYQGAALAVLLDPNGNAYVMDEPASVIAFPNGGASFRVRRLTAGANAYDSAVLGANFDGKDRDYWSLVLDASGYPMVAWRARGAVSAARYH